mmetsp:Transcript_10963/g.21699  ORF Transcript_10963/g.21699 Transcript_10963/m.21699 type:complete len:221 (-) Transcript_10963:109-771(-)|eukprot:CAMPEP_0173390508 /NCGR_PEP_ID=MMETSP1356-20130122/15114_1 /TAXON_ID=77927 ORGANISM="Hemiselmis virescens, Strain PCC157" /NCGR_SAMPLE_ID=MMETSP1356 /ASSEMBLY_ACC=CAM_ASM_000847 /LENGTH=220 /DNA_ID=CAMNT_0014347919 /DNA_START=15 /DNA_END=677 /DNA_ORIENTATION=-
MQALGCGVQALHQSSRRALAAVGELSSVNCWGTTFVRWATKKASSSSDNGRTSLPKFLGVKKYGGEKVITGNIIIRQRGTKFWPGENVGLGKDHTIYSLINGHVKFKWSGHHKQMSVNVLSHLEYGRIAEHKAMEAFAHKNVFKARGYMQQACFAYHLAGEEGREKLVAMDPFRIKLLESATKETENVIEAKRLKGIELAEKREKEADEKRGFRAKKFLM